MEGLFWILLALAVYSYLVYPALLGLVPVRSKPATTAGRPPQWPFMSLIVTAHNEASRLPAKIENSLALDYPAERLEIIVASDASNDGTDEIVESYRHAGLLLARAEERLGKEYAQSLAIARSQGDVLIFSDVATMIPPDSLRHLAELFSDPSLGAVSSMDRFESADGTLAGEGAYVRYEMWLRNRESPRGGLVGLSGSLFACRREVCKPWDIRAPSDFNVALNSRRLGMRSIASPALVGVYRDLANPSDEYARKVRTAVRGMTGLARHPEFLHPRYGVFAFQLWSHKILRWLVPWLLVLLVPVSLALWEEALIYRIAVLGQVAVYGLAIVAHVLPGLRTFTPIRILYYFVQANVAVAEAAVRYLLGQRVTVWQPSLR